MPPLPAVLKIARDLTGVLYAAATIICQAAPKAVEIIQKKWPTNTALLDSVKAVQSACQVMRLNIDEQKTVDAAAERPDVPPIPSPEAPTPPPETP